MQGIDIGTRQEQQRARRVAKLAKLIVRKSRHPISDDNVGGFQLREPDSNLVVLGSRYELTAGDVLTECMIREVHPKDREKFRRQLMEHGVARAIRRSVRKMCIAYRRPGGRMSNVDDAGDTRREQLL